jgi:hypothetical protein
MKRNVLRKGMCTFLVWRAGSEKIDEDVICVLNKMVVNLRAWWKNADKN